MGKQGPCYHCGARETPLWRNGPPGKPVLCNACGSRWRIRGTLENYTPNRGHPGGRRKLRKTSDVVPDLNVDPAIPLSHRTVSASRRNSLTSCILNSNRASEFRKLPRTRSESVTFLGINSENEDDDGITDSGKYVELMEEAADEKDYLSSRNPLAHIKSLHKELLRLYNEEKSSSMRNEEEEALTDNVNPFMYDNEIGFGCFPLKPMLPIAQMGEATLKKASSASSSSLTYHLDAKNESHH